MELSAQEKQELEAVLNEIDREDLRDADPCFHCIASGISLADALFDKSSLDDGPISSDRKCPHCYAVEEEFGASFRKEEKEYAAAVVNFYQAYKRKNSIL